MEAAIQHPENTQENQGVILKLARKLHEANTKFAVKKHQEKSITVSFYLPKLVVEALDTEAKRNDNLRVQHFIHIAKIRYGYDVPKRDRRIPGIKTLPPEVFELPADTYLFFVLPESLVKKIDKEAKSLKKSRRVMCALIIKERFGY